jgi:hypothetical protein
MANTARRRTMKEQPPPKRNDTTPIVTLVKQDLDERMKKGVETYGMPLRAWNGRDALQDAYEEALDLCCYLRQAIQERNGDGWWSK